MAANYFEQPAVTFLGSTTRYIGHLSFENILSSCLFLDSVTLETSQIYLEIPSVLIQIDYNSLSDVKLNDPILHTDLGNKNKNVLIRMPPISNTDYSLNFPGLNEREYYTQLNISIPDTTIFKIYYSNQASIKYNKIKENLEGVLDPVKGIIKSIQSGNDSLKSGKPKLLGILNTITLTENNLKQFKDDLLKKNPNFDYFDSLSSLIKILNKDALKNLKAVSADNNDSSLAAFKQVVDNVQNDEIIASKAQA